MRYSISRDTTLTEQNEQTCKTGWPTDWARFLSLLPSPRWTHHMVRQVMPLQIMRWDTVISQYWPRFKKLIGCCWRAWRDGYTHVWIDTCYIDQKSSSELSESINSMYVLYANCDRCYAYLEDVGTASASSSDSLTATADNSDFRASVWFSRGWTLQELIAPRDVQFLDKTWSVIGSKTSLALTLTSITGIDYGALCGHTQPEEISVAERMSWASERQTTKVEDRAYSLFEIFNANMMTIYGEGDKAFQRLQYEILSQVVDHSIFAWVHTDAGQEDTASGLLASSPSAFSCSGDIVTIPHRIFADQWRHSGQLPAQHVQRTAGGLVLELPLLDRLPKENHYLMAIACGKRGQNACGQSQHCLGIVVSLGMDDRYRRVPGIGWIDAGRLRRQRRDHAGR